MPVTITAAVDPTTAAVRLTIDGGSPEYSVRAVPGGDRDEYVIRSQYATVPGQASRRIAIDGEAPLNVPVQYIVTDRLGVTVSSNVVTATATTPLLADALNPDRVLPVVVVSQPPNEWEARSVWWPILGRTEPFASIAPMLLRRGDLVVRTDTRTQRADLRDLLRTGHPLVLRSTCPDAADDIVMLVERHRDDLANTAAPAGPRHHTITYQAISRDLGPYADPPTRTYADVRAEQATYTALRAAYATYDALLAGDPLAGQGAQQITAGTFPNGPAAPWGTFWTQADVTWDGAADGVARATCATAGPRAAVLWQHPADMTIPAGASVLRVSGRVRHSLGVTASVDLATNAAPAAPQYYEPGVALARSAPLPASFAWTPFSVDLTVGNPAHDVWTVLFRADALTTGSLVEWDDLSARWLT